MKWEYLTKILASQAVDKYLHDDAGPNGWELITVLRVGTSHCHLYFKRPMRLDTIGHLVDDMQQRDLGNNEGEQVSLLDKKKAQN
jgi:hypothetical protein